MNDAIVAVAVGHEDLSRGRDRHVGGLIEARLVFARLSPGADAPQELPLRGELHDLVVADIRHPDVPLRVDLEVMRRVDLLLAPGAQEPAVRVVGLHRRSRSREDPDPLPGVDGDAGHGFPGEPGGLLRPAGIDAIACGRVDAGVILPRLLRVERRGH